MYANYGLKFTKWQVVVQLDAINRMIQGTVYKINEDVLTADVKFNPERYTDREIERHKIFADKLMF